MSKTTQQCLAPLLARWAAPHTPDISGKIQYKLTAPLLADQVENVKVTFDGSGPSAELGEHDAPDVIFTLSGVNFERLADDELPVGKAAMLGAIHVKLNSNRALLLARRLVDAYVARP